MVVTPGPTCRPRPQDAEQLLADEATLRGIDPINYAEPARIRCPGAGHAPRADPGATYRFIDRTMIRGSGRPAGSQGIHRQAGGDARPGRYPDRETAAEPLKSRLAVMLTKDRCSESDLEDAPIRRLQSFLLELGDDFTFVGRQRRAQST